MDYFSTGRVVAPKGAMLFSARKLDPKLPIRPSEALISGRLTLNIDSASFHQISDVCHGDPAMIGDHIAKISARKGKMHNPKTNSGGVVMGTITEMGKYFPVSKFGFGVGDRICTLVSLTVTPLQIDKIVDVRPETEQIDIDGHAILPASGLAAKMPSDFPEPLALAAFDIAGAPSYVEKYVKPGQRVFVIGGGGKSGAFTLCQARKNLGKTGSLIGLDISDQAVDRMKTLGFADYVVKGSALEPLATLETISSITGGKMADLVINVSSRPGTEMASILSVRDGGQIIFFGMATSFQGAALGAEGVGKYAELIMGTGYLPGHADLTLELMRHFPNMLDMLGNIFVERNPNYLPASSAQYVEAQGGPFSVWQKVL
ncbi:zinc-binding dehydrogenase [Candidatus Saganbacteria bacterium]|nr:zinc-binding dehydrogenase [Candidatus Saganbacteria bacterium]